MIWRLRRLRPPREDQEPRLKLISQTSFTLASHPFSRRLFCLGNRWTSMPMRAPHSEIGRQVGSRVRCVTQSSVRRPSPHSLSRILDGPTTWWVRSLSTGSFFPNPLSLSSNGSCLVYLSIIVSAKWIGRNCDILDSVGCWRGRIVSFN